MQIPLQVTFKNMDHSDALELLVREKARKMERFFPRLISMRVVIEAPQRRHHHGDTYRVSVGMTLPDGEIVANRDPGLNHAHEDVKVAIRDSFLAARRQLQDFVRKHYGTQISPRETPPRGKVLRIFPGEGYGFLLSEDGREIYFHENSVLGNAFKELNEGDEVVYKEERGDKGPQASTVHF